MANVRVKPVVDLFAGPGGLGEGFSSLRIGGIPRFRIGLSIEKDSEAHSTLRLRSFLRQFGEDIPDEYYEYLRGDICLADLLNGFPREARAAAEEAWCAELGVVDSSELHRRVKEAIAGSEHWVLIGGPPCQAYSVVGRSRMRGADPAKYERDPRHFLYREYLKILARHRPPVFVMENVKGLLSATHGDASMFDRILDDLREPVRALGAADRPKLRYRLYALSPVVQVPLVAGEQDPSEFVIRCEEFGIPQARHRVIILGVREGVAGVPRSLKEFGRAVTVDDVTADLPRLRSRISRGEDSAEAWLSLLRSCSAALKSDAGNRALSRYLRSLVLSPGDVPGLGAEYSRTGSRPRYRADWYHDKRLGGVCNHESRSHLGGDIQRYFFAAAFARAQDGNARSPVLSEFPSNLLPNHQNVGQALEGRMFNDRFRVQVATRPSTTITSHIAKDGHYYIHPDPLQARSFTVREAARLQTFPDNYLFCGPRTSQYHQVGNAVPPLIARQIAEVVDELMGG